MKIVFTGGGSGGHFYPIIAIAEAIRELEQKERILASELYFVSTAPYDEEVLSNNDVTEEEKRKE